MAQSPDHSQNPRRDASPAPTAQTPRGAPPAGQQGNYGSPYPPQGHQYSMGGPAYPGYTQGPFGSLSPPGAMYQPYPQSTPGFAPPPPGFSNQPPHPGHDARDDSTHAGEGGRPHAARPTDFRSQQQGNFQHYPQQGYPLQPPPPGEDRRSASPYPQSDYGDRDVKTPEQQQFSPEQQRSFQQFPGHYQSPPYPGYQQPTGYPNQPGYFDQSRPASAGGGQGHQGQGWYGPPPFDHSMKPEYSAQESPSRQGQTPVSEAEEEGKETVPEAGEPKGTICVRGITKKTSEEELSLYFENKRSGGGEIENVQIRKDGSALITFTNPEVAAKVCSKEIHKHGGCTWTVALHDDTSDRGNTGSTNVVVVSGLDPNISEDVLELYFESKRSGGGEIDSLKMKKGVAYITFKEEQVAKKVVSRDHKIGGKEVTVKLDKTVQHRTIAVTGIKPNVHKDTLVMYFESKRKSGGGEVGDTKLERNVLYIQFKLEEDFQRVMKRTSHAVAGNKLTVVKAGEEVLEETSDNSDSDKESTKASAMVEVRGYPKDISDDTITLYFENKRKSGGGDVELISRNDKKGIILLKYDGPEVAESVASREHTLQGQKLQVKVSVPQDMYKDKVMLSGVPDATSDNLTLYLEARTQLDVEDLLYGEEEGDVLVTFTSSFKEITSLSAAMKKKPFLKTTLLVSEVPKTSSITVRNLPDSSSQDQVTMYFENTRRSGGQDVEEVLYNPSEKMAVVRFKDTGVAVGVCKRQHKLGSCAVEVSLHFECLGESGGSVEPPCTKVPDPVQFKEIDEYKIKFLTANTEGFDRIKAEVANLRGKLELDLMNKSITVIPTFTKDDKEAKEVTKTWTKDVNKAMTAQLSAIEIDKMHVNSEIWPDVEPKMNEFRGQTDIHVFTEEQNWLVVVAGPVEKVRNISKKVKAIIQAVQADNDRRKNQITEKKNVKAGKLRVIVAKGFVQNMSKEYLNVTCDTISGDVEFKGPKEDVQNALFTLLETINQISEETITRFTQDQVELLKRTEVEKYLAKKQENQGRAVAGSWAVGREGIIIYYPQDEEVGDMIDFLTASLQQTTIKLDNENLPLLESPQFRDAVDKLKQDREGRVIITPQSQRRKIQITAIAEDLDYTRTAVEHFIQGNTIYKEAMKYSQSVLKFIVLHCKDKLDSISQDLKKFCVRFDCGGSGSTFQVTLKATKEGMGQAKLFLKAIADPVKCYQEVLKKVGINTFIESGDVLSQVEKSTRCVISKTPDDQAAGHREGSGIVSGQSYDTAFTCTPDTNKTVTVVVGDLAALVSDVEAVVVEATSELEPDSAQASSIVGIAGDRVMQEAKRYARSSASFLEGEVYCSSPGRLKCKVLIYAVSPTSGSDIDPSDVIKAVILATLEEANKNFARSLALPSFNTETIRRTMSSEDCFKYIMEGIKCYFDENPGSGVINIYVCIEDIKQCQSLWSQSVTVFGEDKVVTKQIERKPEEEQGTLRHRRRSGLTRNSQSMNLSGPISIPSDIIQEANVQVEEEAPPPPPPEVEAAAPDPPPLAKPRILLVKADMGVEEADVIVNSSNISLDLNKGMVSMSLIQHAGQSIQAECKTSYPDGIKAGEIAVTKGGDMQCVEQIYHCVLPNWDATTGKQTLIDTLNKLLLKAHEGKWKTMAIPALGTGNLGFARDLVAQVMYETVSQFGKDHPDTTLNDVLFIVYPGDPESCKIFEAENKKHIEATGGKVAATMEEIETEREEEMVAYREHLLANKESRDNPTPAPEPTASGWSFSGLKKYLPWQTESDAPKVPDFSSLPRTPSSPDVTLWIYTDDPQNVQRAVDVIYRDMASEVQTKNIDEKTLKTWTAEQMKELTKLEKTYQVTIKPNKMLGRIIISGLLNDLSEALTHIHKLIREVEKEKQEQEYADELVKVVQWYFIDIDETTQADKTVAYDPRTNAKLERAFTKENKTELRYEGYIFDFRKWVEYPVADDSDQAKIMRKDRVVAASSKPPDTWEDTTDDISVKLVTKDTPEYKAVEKNVTDSFATAGTAVDIIRMDRVQNKTLFQQYQAKKQQMENQTSGAVTEKMLWHGTKQDNNMNICNYGFNRSYCDKTQSTYGEGVYFTTTAPGAAQDIYAPADPQGKRYIFQSKVLTGSYTKGQSTFRVLPAKDPSKPTDLYDSVVDDQQNPTTFVIFSDTQAYPEYLITIKC